ncbi:PREDICTED: uncharacterized protein LOC106117564 [Papilio xuthus]|uniref:Uncharacterized protein LOC106117564 n=1 Tax=Papilio xuthus TaxID=66420 RepID=A0AAJ6Z8M5_PAPXU|nr:PREDICTED: uncharacterized protein LOC106117564 [Papilio xuthus]
MDCRIILCFAVIFSSHILSYRIDKEDLPNDSLYDDDDYDYSYDDVESRKDTEDSIKDNKNTTTPKPATYEVTENVDDIPNPSTKFGTIFTNYSTPRPLNNASFPTVQKPTDKPETNSESNNELNNNSNEDVKGKKNSFSILHVQGEYDDVPNGPSNWGEHHMHNKLGIKDYIYGISKGIYNKISRLFNKHDCDDKHVFRTDNFDESHFRSENSKTENRFVHDDTYLLSDYE